MYYGGIFMNDVTQKNELVMKLLHYFITEKNYNPIILQGAENEIWNDCPGSRVSYRFDRG